MIINATNTPPNVIKNIPNEVSCGAGRTRRAGFVVAAIIFFVGLTTEVIIADEELMDFVLSGRMLV